jgi:hypothetical protein
MLRRIARKVKGEILVPLGNGTCQVVRCAAGRAIDSLWWELGNSELSLAAFCGIWTRR